MFKLGRKMILSTLLILALLLPTHALAAKPITVDPCYTYIYRISTGIVVEGNNVICEGSACTKTSSTTTTVKVTLQRRPVGNSTWVYVTSWTDTASGLLAAWVSESYPITSGNQYRLYTTATIKNSSGTTVEHAYIYSHIVP